MRLDRIHRGSGQKVQSALEQLVQRRLPAHGTVQNDRRRLEPGNVSKLLKHLPHGLVILALAGNHLPTQRIPVLIGQKHDAYRFFISVTLLGPGALGNIAAASLKIRKRIGTSCFCAELSSLADTCGHCSYAIMLAKSFY